MTSMGEMSPAIMQILFVRRPPKCEPFRSLAQRLPNFFHSAAELFGFVRLLHHFVNFFRELLGGKRIGNGIDSLCKLIIIVFSFFFSLDFLCRLLGFLDFS